MNQSVPEEIGSASSGEAPAPSLLEVLRLLLRRTRLIIGCGLGFAGCAGILTLVWPASYTVSATFYPQTSGGVLSSLAGVAAQFGVGLPDQDPTQSPDFYTVLLQSEGLLSAIVDTSYTIKKGGSTAPAQLADLWHIRGPDSAVRRQKTVVALGERLNVSTNRQVGLVSLSLTDRRPEVALQVVRRALDLMNRFNILQRQTQAGAERQFVEGRRDSAATDLHQAEQRIQAFLTQNRTYAGSPALQFEYDRLTREMQMRQTLYTTLAQSLDQARIEEVRNTPVITIVDPPVYPAISDRKHGAIKVILGLLFGGALGVGVVAFQEWMRRVEEQDPGLIGELRELIRRAVGPASRFLRRSAKQPSTSLPG